MSNSLVQNLKKLQELENEYFKLFNKFYPTFYDESKGGIFGPNELYEMAIEVEVLLTSLGPTAVKRLMYIGFDLLFPFNNPVDWFNWKTLIIEKNVSHTIYFSVSTRVATEFKRIELHLENDTWDNYCALSESEFSSSKERYKELFFEHKNDCSESNIIEPPCSQPVHQININEITYNEKVESEAINNLEQLNQRTGVWSNVANVASTIMKVSGIKI